MINIEETLDKIGLVKYQSRGEEVIYWCPICGDHPTHGHAHLSINTISGKFFCFFCNTGGPLEYLCKLLGKEAALADDDYVVRKSVERKEKKEPITLSDKAVHYYFDTLYYAPFRDFKEGTLKKFQVKYDFDLKTYIFMLRDSEGKAFGYSIRASKGYIHTPKGLSVGHTLYGLHLVEEDTVYIAEGMTDVMRLSEAGYPAVGVFGNNIRNGQVDLLRRFKHIIIVPDNDHTLFGGKNTGLLSSAGKLRHFTKVSYVIPEKKDIGMYKTSEVSVVVSGVKPLSRLYDEILVID